MTATAVNSQITDAVAQTGMQVGPAGAALAVDMALQGYALAMGMAMENAVLAQARTQVLAHAALAAATARIAQGGVP